MFPPASARTHWQQGGQRTGGRCGSTRARTGGSQRHRQAAGWCRRRLTWGSKTQACSGCLTAALCSRARPVRCGRRETARCSTRRRGSSAWRAHPRGSLWNQTLARNASHGTMRTTMVLRSMLTELAQRQQARASGSRSRSRRQWIGGAATCSCAAASSPRLVSRRSTLTPSTIAATVRTVCPATIYPMCSRPRAPTAMHMRCRKDGAASVSRCPREPIA